MPNFDRLLKRFPKLELSYVNNTHKKVHKYDICSAIPKGTKYFAWFTYYNNQNICLLMSISSNKIITDIQHAIVSFHDDLALGTILYGTVVIEKLYNTKMFIIEDVYYYCGNDVSKEKYMDKCSLYKTLFETKLNQVKYIDECLIFGLPLMHTKLYDLEKIINTASYPIYCIQYRTNQKNSPVVNVKYVNSNVSYSIFLVRPDVKNDIYHLYGIKNHKEAYYDIAHIPDFKTSVMMNKLFRNIRENDNLDVLEESEDEDEFENIAEDKFVDLNKIYKMRCAFNSKFKRWVPIDIAKDSDPIKNVF